MKKLLVALSIAATIFVSSVTAALATCTGPAVMHDFPGTSFNMSLATNAGDGNCASNIAIVGTLPAFASTPTVNLGTIAGAGTAANQTSIFGILGNASTATTAHGCSVAGYSILGCLGQLDDDIKSAIPTQASTVSIGGVGLFSGGSIMSATNGLYTNLLQANAVIASGNPLFAQLTAGSAIVGKFGIDQTTPGTTNAVSASVPTWAGGTLGAMANYGTSPGAVLVPGVNAFITNTPPVSQSGTWNVGLTGTLPAFAAVPSFKQTDGTTVVITDPCQGAAPTYTPINISASGSTKIITGTSAKKTYICDFHVVTNAANNVALIEGTVTNCGTGTAGMAGGTTAASGWNFSANGGISFGSGGFSMMNSATNADDVCLIVSASTQLSGGVKWVQQ